MAEVSNKLCGYHGIKLDGCRNGDTCGFLHTNSQRENVRGFKALKKSFNWLRVSSEMPLKKQAVFLEKSLKKQSCEIYLCDC